MMTKRQKAVLIAMVVIMSAMCIYPPFVMIIDPRYGESLYKYGFIWNSPIYTYYSDYQKRKIESTRKTKIDTNRLFIQMIPVLVVGGLLVFLFGTPRRPKE